MKDYASIAAIVLRLRKSDRLLPTESVPYPMGTNSLVGAVVTNAGAALRWLGARRPDLDEAREALSGIIVDGHRASDVVCRIRIMSEAG
jgi:hypothetical protein